MENRNGLLVGTRVTPAYGTAERNAALRMAEKIPGTRRVTLGGDKNYDTRDFVRELRRMKITPHVAQNNRNRSSAIDGRTTRQAGYAISQQKRKRVEQSFGWSDRHAAESEVERPRERELVVHRRGRSLQLGSTAKSASGGGSLSGSSEKHREGPQRAFRPPSNPPRGSSSFSF